MTARDRSEHWNARNQKLETHCAQEIQMNPRRGCLIWATELEWRLRFWRCLLDAVCCS